jgi:hypothetical protein
MELDYTGKAFRIFTLKPYVMFRAANYVDLGFGMYFGRLGPAGSATVPETSPVVQVSYTF